MINSIGNKLVLLFTASILLVVTILLSLGVTYKEQGLIHNELNSLMKIELDIDLMRSQLWVFLQHQDEAAFKHIYQAQRNLDNSLNNFIGDSRYLANVKQMNQSLLGLLEHERQLLLAQESLLEAKPNVRSLSIKPQTLLHSRYNMIMQNMTEEVFYIHQTLLKASAKLQLTNLLATAAVNLIIAIITCGIAWRILKRFNAGSKALKTGIEKLSEGEMSYQMREDAMDREFARLARFFNRMTQSLRDSLVTREELEQQVKIKTAQLERKKQKLQFISEHDPLTGLKNRLAFEKALDNAVIKANRSGVKLAVLFIDLDKFKEVNDNKGHDAGDYVLSSIASRLKKSVRSSDFVGRLGGDEFVVCLDLLESFDAVPAKIENLIASLSQPIIYKEQKLEVDVSIGVSYFPQHADNPKGLINAADQAMYQAKTGEGSGYREVGG